MHIFEVLCALAVALLCSDVEATSFTTVKQLHGTTKDLDRVQLKVTCGGKCAIRDIQFDEGDNAVLWAYYKSGGNINTICYSDDGKCPGIPQTAQPISEFFIRLFPSPAFTGGEITLKTDDRGATIREINAEGASIRSGQSSCGSNTNCVRLKSGLGATAFPNLKKQFKVTCNGNCRNLVFAANTSQDVMLALAEGEPVFAKKGGCYNCVCTSTGGNPKECKNSAGKSRFTLKSNNVYITLVPNNKLTDVVAYLGGDNIISVSRDKSRGLRYSFASKNGKRAVVYPVTGPFTRAKKVRLQVTCKDYKKCKNVKIEVFSDSLLDVSAGTKAVVSCSGVKSCATTFDPALMRHFNYYFYVYVGLNSRNRHFMAYVKISGDNVGYVKFGDAYDY